MGQSGVAGEMALPPKRDLKLIHIHYHANLKEVQSDAALAALLDAPAQNAPFNRLAWWQGLADHCGLLPLLAVAKNGADMAVLPLATADGHLCALANYYTFRYRPIVSENADAPALLTTLARDLRRNHNHITLTHLPDEDSTHTLTAAVFRDAGWLVDLQKCDDNHILHVNGRNFTTYLAARPGQLRTTLKRKAHKVAVTLFDHFDASAWADYEHVYANSWKPEEGSPAFLRSFAEQEGAAGRLRMAIAHFEGQAVAAQFWTVEGGTAFIHKLAHTEASKPLSPGTALSAALFERVIDRDHVHTVDFGTGNDGYKRDWMEQQRHRYRLTAWNPGSPQQWPKIAKHMLTKLAATIRRS